MLAVDHVIKIPVVHAGFSLHKKISKVNCLRREGGLRGSTQQTFPNPPLLDAYAKTWLRAHLENLNAPNILPKAQSGCIDHAVIRKWLCSAQLKQRSQRKVKKKKDLSPSMKGIILQHKAPVRNRQDGAGSKQDAPHISTPKHGFPFSLSLSLSLSLSRKSAQRQETQNKEAPQMEMSCLHAPWVGHCCQKWG